MYFHRLIFILSVFFLSSIYSFSYAVSIGKLASEEIVERLQLGGYILYIRHASTNHNQTESFGSPNYRIKYPLGLKTCFSGQSDMRLIGPGVSN